MVEASRTRSHRVEHDTEAGLSGSDGEHLCAGCSRSFRGMRCDHCGVPRAPGGYRIERIIGQGNHSRVYEAVKEGRRVALKELVFALVPDRSRLDAFEREAALLRQLRHPRIPRFVDSFSEGEGVHQRLYLAQELVPGISLYDSLLQHRYTEAEALQIAREVLEVLIYLHGLSPRVIHRDIKPANLIRRPDGSLALVDFGAARDLQRGVTHGATLVGTFGYMPPEQLGGTVDETADLYALGATLIHLLSRRPPDELLRHDMALDFAGSLNVSKRTASFLARLVARRREDRFRSAREALAALDAKEVQPVAPRPAAKRVSPRTSIVVTAIGMAAGVLLNYYLATAHREPAAPPRPAIERRAPVERTQAPPRPQTESKPSKQERGAAKREVAQVEVAQVETLRAPPDRGLLRDDQQFRLGATVEPPLEGCASPPTVVLETAKLVAEGPGTLEDPRSRMQLDVKLRTNGADSACEAVDVMLRAPGGESVARTRRLSSQWPGREMHRTLDFTIPRTLRQVDVCVGGTCVVRLGLGTGKVERL